MDRGARTHRLSTRWAKDLPDDAQSYAGRWAAGVSRQHERLTRGPDRYGEDGLILDAIQYVMCLRNLIRSALLVRDSLMPYASEHVTYWLNDFNRRCPGVIAARNLLEHFDEYALGVGREQKRHPHTPLRIQLEHVGYRNWKLVLVAAGKRIVIDVDKATAAAADLWIGLAVAPDAAFDEEAINTMTDEDRAAIDREIAGTHQAPSHRPRWLK